MVFAFLFRHDFPLRKYRSIRIVILFTLLSLSFSHSIGPLSRTSHWPTPGETRVRWSVARLTGRFFFSTIATSHAYAFPAKEVGHSIPGISAAIQNSLRSAPNTLHPSASETDRVIDLKQNAFSRVRASIFAGCIWLWNFECFVEFVPVLRIW